MGAGKTIGQNGEARAIAHPARAERQHDAGGLSPRRAPAEPARRVIAPLRAHHPLCSCTRRNFPSRLGQVRCPRRRCPSRPSPAHHRCRPKQIRRCRNRLHCRRSLRSPSRPSRRHRSRWNRRFQTPRHPCPSRFHQSLRCSRRSPRRFRRSLRWSLRTRRRPCPRRRCHPRSSHPRLRSRPCPPSRSCRRSRPGARSFPGSLR